MLVDQMRGGGRTVTLARHGTVAGRPAAAMVRAVVVDEAELMHFAVRALLSTVPGYTMVASASSVSDGEQLVRRVPADTAGERGSGRCGWVRRASPPTCVAILPSRDEPLLAQSALAAGAHGYL